MDDEARVLIFNHPFFPEDPYKEISVSKSMLGREDLIHRFFNTAPRYLRKNGCIIMSYFHLAGDSNNPSIKGPKHGFKVYERFKLNVSDGLQQGSFSIYELNKSW